MLTPVMDRLNTMADTLIRYPLYLMFKPIVERFRSCVHSTAGLVITATAGKKVPKIGAAACHYQAKGVNGQIAAGTDMPALVGTVANATWNIFVFTVDKAGNLYSYMGTAGATDGTVKWPVLNTEHAIIGYIKINPTGTGNFVGGTTALDDVTVVPNTQYISPVGALFPPARVD